MAEFGARFVRSRAPKRGRNSAARGPGGRRRCFILRRRLVLGVLRPRLRTRSGGLND
jgi:hypothetical protein